MPCSNEQNSFGLLSFVFCLMRCYRLDDAENGAGRADAHPIRRQHATEQHFVDIQLKWSKTKLISSHVAV